MFGIFKKAECHDHWAEVRRMMLEYLGSFCKLGNIIITDRPWQERRQFWEECSLFPRCCLHHLGGNVINELNSAPAWRLVEGAFDNYMYADRVAASEAARKALHELNPAVDEYLVRSEFGQHVFSDADIAEQPSLATSFTQLAVVDFQRTHRTHMPHHRLDKPPITTSNGVERKNWSDKVRRENGVYAVFRCQGCR
jgi:hypothetical protein